jgi:hypothetical protein
MDQFLLSIAQLIQRFPFVPACFLIGVVGGLTVMADSLPHTRKRRLGRAVALACLGLFGASVAVMKSDPGRWATAMHKDTVAAYNGMLIDVPDSRYRAKAVARLRSLQYALLDRDDTSLVMFLFCAMYFQGDQPYRLYIVIDGHRRYRSDHRRAKVARYDRVLDRFERDLSGMIEDLVAPFAPVISAEERPPPKRTAPVVAIRYIADWDGPFVQYSASAYDFDAISLAAGWSIFLPQHPAAALWGETERAYPPGHPTWKGSKYPEEVVGDIVAENTLAQLKTAFTRQRPGVWGCPLAPN